jgi:hypothetical protein
MKELEKFNTLKDGKHRALALVRVIRNFNKGYQAIITLGTYFDFFKDGIDPSPEYQRPYHYRDEDPNEIGTAWQRNLIGDLIRGEDIPPITLRQIDKVVAVSGGGTSIDILLHELIDGGHRSRTFFNFYTGHLKTPKGLEVSVKGTVYEIGNKFWSELPQQVRDYILNDLVLDLKVYVNITDQYAGYKFKKLNDLHDMSAQEKRQSDKVQVSESVRELSAIDKTDFNMLERVGMKFRWVNLSVTGRVTDEITARIAYALKEDLVGTHINDINSYAKLAANKTQLDAMYDDDARQEDKKGVYHKSSKLMTRVKDILTVISKIAYENRTDDSMNPKVWSKMSILKLSLMINEWMEVYGVQSILRMNAKLFWSKLSVLYRSKMSDYEYRAKARYHIVGNKVEILSKLDDVDERYPFSKVWGTGDRIDDFEWIKLTIEAGWNPAEWGIIKLDPQRDFTKKQRKQIFDNDNHKCVKCGAEERLEADHIEPWEKGGRTDVSNGQTLCKPCNASKSNNYETETLGGKDDNELGDLFRNGKITLEQMKAALSKGAA